MGCVCNSEKSLKEKENQQKNQNAGVNIYNKENIAQNINESNKNYENNQLLTITNYETLPTETDLKKQNINNVQSMDFTKQNFNLELFNILEIKKHNELRKKHHVDDLILNKELMQIAQKHAEKIAKTNNFSHSDDKSRELKDHKGEWVGENIYYFSTSAKLTYASGSSSQAWYDEIKNYNFEKGESSNGGVVGHFTQVVWKNTKEAGFGLAFGKNECYVVGNYYPGGNFNNEEKNNVFPK